MLSNAQIKRLSGLKEKKIRREAGVFVAETPKTAEVLLSGNIPVLEIYALKTWLEDEGVVARIESCAQRQAFPIAVTEISPKELERISSLKTPQEVFLVLAYPSGLHRLDDIYAGCSLVLDNLRDPGNLGTIIRIADWFGIDRIICTEECADAFQPKCVQASMGSVGVCDLRCLTRAEIIQAMRKPELEVYGTFLRGKNLYETELPQNNVWYVIGNEAQGIASDFEREIRHRLRIPPAPKHKPTGAESLNAAVAAAVLCSELKRSCSR